MKYARACLIPKGIDNAGTSIVPFREPSKEEVVDEMGTGINLGNTMDGHSSMTPGELVWQPDTPVTNTESPIVTPIVTPSEIPSVNDNDNTPKIKKIKLVNVKTNKLVLAKLKKGKTYYIRVRAVKKSGAGKEYGNRSKIFKKKM